MQKILFRTDAGAGIGYGHFIRTLALADMLKDDFDCSFYTSEPTPYQVAQMDGVCPYFSLEEQTKFHQFLDCLKGDEIVVLDNYFFTTDYQRWIKAKGCKLVCIDDMHDKHYVADLIINQGICWTKQDYSCEPYTRFAFGLKYSLLRKPFFEACEKRSVKNAKDGSMSIVVAFGGSDFLDLTHKVVLGIKDLPQVRNITAIVGDRYASEKIIISEKVEYKKNLTAEKIADLFLKTDIAILPASTMMNEAMACGTFIIGGFYVNNQEYDYYSYLKENMIIGVGDYSDYDCVERIIKALSKKETRVINGITQDTPQRMIELFKSL